MVWNGANAIPGPWLWSIPACAGEPNQPATLVRPYIQGSIPACAGEPSVRTSRAYPSKTGLSPRVRGNPPSCRCTGLALPKVMGLSPRVRGNPGHTELYQAGHERSIPACAGEPAAPDSHASSNRRGSIGLSRRCGLSPRVRGNRQSERMVEPIPGVYPRVCGGTYRPRAQYTLGRGWVYPRVCGGTYAP